MMAPRFPLGFSRCPEGVPAGSTVPCSLVQIQTSSSSRCLRCVTAVVAVMGHIYGFVDRRQEWVGVDLLGTLVFHVA
jgi:hypothetical protein